jgi:outer membrane protein OmpA-like peptidoglycan-associated protein
MKKFFLTALLSTFFAYLTPASAQTMLDQTILFKKDSVNIMESQKDRIGLVVEYIRRHPDSMVIIGGFCGTATAKEKVDAIAQKRADEVKKYIVETFRIPESKLVALGAGVSTRYPDPEQNEVVSFFVK